jgi:hypothetical protein
MGRCLDRGPLGIPFDDLLDSSCATGGFGRSCFPFGKHWLQIARRSRVRSVWWVFPDPVAARVRAKLGLEILRFSPATPHFSAKDS